jgi:hypothetical protein
MLFKKTPQKERGTYTYVEHYKDENGKLHTRRITLRPGENGVTAVDIKRLHAADDAEIHNNIKNCKLPVEEWEKPLIEGWQREHPDEDPPKRWCVSIEAASESDDGENCGDSASILSEFAYSDEETVSPAVDRLREIVASCTPLQQETYQKVVIEGVPMSTIAKQEGISETAIRHRMDKIYARIAKDTILQAMQKK